MSKVKLGEDLRKPTGNLGTRTICFPRSSGHTDVDGPICPLSRSKVHCHICHLPFAVMYLGSRAQQSHCMCQCGSQLLDDFPFGICHRMWFPSTWLVGILVVWVAPVTHPITFPGFFLPGYEPLRKRCFPFIYGADINPFCGADINPSLPFGVSSV